MRTILLAIAGCVCGAIGGVVLLFSAYLLVIIVSRYEDVHGTTSLALATFAAPAAALAGGVAGAVLMVRRTRRGSAAAADGFARRLDAPGDG